jgi:hypothetical protein
MDTPPSKKQQKNMTYHDNIYNHSIDAPRSPLSIVDIKEPVFMELDLVGFSGSSRSEFPAAHGDMTIKHGKLGNLPCKILYMEMASWEIHA